jgi:preprotein translocase SecE subunit
LTAEGLLSKVGFFSDKGEVVAKAGPNSKKPRIRKTAPTIRERVEATSAKEGAVKPKRVRSAASKIFPVKKLRLGSRKPVKWLGRILRPFGRLLKWITPSYFINSWREIRKVVWPSRKETWRLTLAVFIFAIVFGAMVAGVDKGLDVIFKKLVLK